MFLPTTEALEILPTELADNVLEVIVEFLHSSGRSLDVGSHILDLVIGEILPIFSVEIASLAVEMLWIIFLVLFHLLQAVKHALAALLGAVDFDALVGLPRCTIRDGVGGIARYGGARGVCHADGNAGVVGGSESDGKMNVDVVWKNWWMERMKF